VRIPYASSLRWSEDIAGEWLRLLQAVLGACPHPKNPLKGWQDSFSSSSCQLQPRKKYRFVAGAAQAAAGGRAVQRRRVGNGQSFLFGVFPQSKSLAESRQTHQSVTVFEYRLK